MPPGTLPGSRASLAWRGGSAPGRAGGLKPRHLAPPGAPRRRGPAPGRWGLIAPVSLHLQWNGPRRHTLVLTFPAVTLALAAVLLAASSPAGEAPSPLARPDPAPRSSSPSPLARVLARTFRFYGGLDALLSVEGFRLDGTLADATTPPASRPRVERVLSPPDRYRSAVSLGGLEREILVLDGHRAFRDGAEVTGLIRADLIRLEAARAFLPAALARSRESLLDRGEARRGGRIVRLVELPLHEQASLTAEIEASSGTIVRAIIRTGARETAVSFSRFRPVGGVVFPFAEDLVAGKDRRTLLVERIELVPATSISVEAP